MKRQSETTVVHSAPADGGSGGGKSLYPAGDASGAGGDITNTLGEEAPPNAPRLRVRIKRYHAVAKWSWNVGGGSGSMASLSLNDTVDEDVCTICQSPYEGTAPGTKFPGDECPVVWGKCGHSFHLTCVSTWLASKSTCPYCRAEWEFGAEEGNGGPDMEGGRTLPGGSDDAGEDGDAGNDNGVSHDIDDHDDINSFSSFERS